MADDNIILDADTDGEEFEESSEPSLRDTLEAKWNELEATKDTSDEVESPGPARDANGRFTKKESEQTDTSVEEPTIETGTQQVMESAVPSTPVLAPSSWTGEEKEQFNQLPPALQQTVLRRETDIRRYLQQETEKLSQRERTYAGVEEALAPRMNDFARHGVTPGQVVNQLMAWQQYLDSNPKNALRELAQSYGMDLRQLAEEQPEQPQEPTYVRELRGQVQQMQGLLQQSFQQQAEREKQVRTNAVLENLQTFANATDAKGNKLRPHIDHVAEDMVPFIQYLNATNPQMPEMDKLQAAYEKAIWSNPSTRELELKRTTPIITSSPTKEVVQRAKRASGKFLNGEAVGPAVVEKPATVRKALETAWDKIHGE